MRVQKLTMISGKNESYYIITNLDELEDADDLSEGRYQLEKYGVVITNKNFVPITDKEKLKELEENGMIKDQSGNHRIQLILNLIELDILTMWNPFKKNFAKLTAEEIRKQMISSADFKENKGQILAYLKERISFSDSIHERNPWKLSKWEREWLVKIKEIFSSLR